MTTSTSSVETQPTFEASSVTDLTIDFIRSLEPRVRMVDSDNNIQLFCYTNCSPEDTEFVKSCRGVVFENDKLILKPFSYTPEFTVEDKETLDTLVPPQLEGCRVFHSHEGVLIRCFYAQDKWYVSTQRRLDAYKSKWASRASFGEMFNTALGNELQQGTGFQEYMDSFHRDETEEMSCVDAFVRTLDQSKQYMFLVENDKENRIVCDVNEHPRVFHVGTFTNGVLDFESSVGLRKPEEKQFTSLEELMVYVEGLDERTLQGVIIFTPTDQLKIINSRYSYWFSLRGNEPSIKFRYLQLRMDMKRLEDFKMLYPEYMRTFEKYEDAIYDIMSQIKNAYIKRFIKKEYVTMPPEEFAVMRDLHSWHLEDRANNHISTNKVIDIVNQQSPTKLNKMIRRFMNEERLKTVADIAVPSFENKMLAQQQN